jgi:hypothetical protein
MAEENDPTPTPAPKQRVEPVLDPAPSKTAWTGINRELSEHRDRANTAEQRATQLEADLARANAALTAKAAEKAAAEAAKTAAEAAVAEASAKIKGVTTEASIRVAAIQAGIVDLDALALIDRAALETDESGALKDGAAVMAALKEKKPYLFGVAPAAKKPNSANPENPPAPKPPGAKPALEMTDEEFAIARKSGAWRS